MIAAVYIIVAMIELFNVYHEQGANPSEKSEMASYYSRPTELTKYLPALGYFLLGILHIVEGATEHGNIVRIVDKHLKEVYGTIIKKTK